MKRRTNVFALAILSVIAAVLALWALSPWILQSMVAGAMQTRGFDNVELDMARPGLDGAWASRLSFDIGDGAASVRVEGIDAGYTMSGLLEGRLRSLSVEAVHIIRRDKAGNAAPLALPATLPGFDPAPVLAAIPAGGVTVSRVTLSTDDGEPGFLPVSLKITRGGDGASALAVVVPVEPGTADRAFEVVVERSGRINGALAWQDASVNPALEFTLARTDTAGAWSGRVSGDAAAVGEWLAPLVGTAPPLSACRVEAAVRLDDNPLDALHVDADLSGCRVGAYDFASGSVRGRFMRTANGMASVTPVRVSLEAASGPGFQARSLVLSSGVDVDFEAGTVALPAGATLRAAGLKAGDIDAGEVSATLRESVRVSASSPRGRVIADAAGAGLAWRGDPVSLAGVVVEIPFDDDGIALPAVRVAEVTMDAAEFAATASSIAARPQGAAIVVQTPRIDITRENASAVVENANVVVALRGDDAETLDARAGAVIVDAAGFRARLDAFAGRADWRGGGIGANFDARLAGAMPVNGRLQTDAGAPSGRLVIEGPPVALGEDVERASNLVGGWPAGIDLVGGRAGFTVDVGWSAAGVKAGARVELDGAGGVVRDIFFSDATMTLELDVYPDLRTTQPAVVSVGTVDYGLALTGIGATVTLDGMVDGAPVLTATDVRADAFDGVVRVPRFAGGGAFDVLLENIDLARLVGDDRFPGLAMSGRVGGRVPVEIRDDGVYINRGLLENSGSGVLHYDPGNVGAGSGAQILFKALKEFEYSVLRVEPEYHPDGTLLLAIHMEGTSAELGRSQPIHFNVNVEQNLLKLLESIRLVDGLNERIDQRVQQYYKRSQ